MEHFVLYNIYVTIIWRYFYEKTLALIFVIFCFTACSCNDKTNTAAKDSNNSHIQTSEDSSYSDNSHIQTSEDSSYSSDTEDDSATEEAGVTIANIYGGYREGLMFVDKEKSGMSIHPIACIDKTGKTAFTVEASSVISGFCNGLALIRQEEKAVLCDKTGKIITAEDLGGNAFINESFIFEDGYVLLKRTTTSYQGSYDEMAVFNSKLEKIVDFSQELYETYERVSYYSSTKCYGGYLFNTVVDGYLDLNTGTRSEVSSELMNKIQPKRESDFWCVGERYNSMFYPENDEELFIYDARKSWFSDEYSPTIPVIYDLSEYPNSYVISRGFLDNGYVDGYAGMRFRVKDSEKGERNYFTVMDESGEFCFEPIETQGIISQVESENGVFVLIVAANDWSDDYFYVEVYDCSGKIGSKQYKRSKDGYIMVEFDISDGVIYIENSLGYNEKKQIELYTTELETLFEVN